MARTRARTPTILQIEAAECGAAALGMVLGHYGRHIPLETLRRQCGISRDGAKASNLLKAARSYGLVAKGLKAEPEHLGSLQMPCVAFVDFCHFLVVEGVGRDRVYLNDPASGRRRVRMAEFDAMFTGVVLTFEPGQDFAASDERPSLAAALVARTSGARLAVLYVLLASLALVLPGLVLPVMARAFVDYVLVRELNDWLGPIVIGMALTALLRFVLLELRGLVLTRAETRLAVDGARDMFLHMLRLPIAFFGSRFAGEVAGRLDLSDGLASLLTGQVAQVVLNLFTASFFFVLMLAYDPAIAWAVLALSLVNLAAILFTARANADAHRRLSIDAGKLSGVALAGVRDIETFKAAGAEGAFFARWSGLHANVVNATQAIARRQAILGAVPPLLGALTTAVVLVLGGWRIMDAGMTVGSLVALQTLAASFTAPVVALTDLGTRLQEIRSFTERTDDVLRHPIEPEGSNIATEALAVQGGMVSVRNASYGHLPLEPPLLSDFSLDLPEGGSVALVGPSGSGKSTLGRLIAGLYPPDSGIIAIGGRPLCDWPRAARADALAYIDQDIMLFEGSVRENLSLWDDSLAEAQIVRAAQDALIHDVIAARPGGYDSHVEEGGRNFSGGQRQRLEIARALATDPRILVMDEATSALDADTEAAIMANLRARGTTLVLIAHRLSTVRDCDEIIVLDGGRVTERGKHDKLMARGAAYAALIEA
jgi:NHLM bacteriocin system ABC transporter peptidase/ATP-binding protein